MLHEDFNHTLFQFIEETNKLTYNMAKDHKPDSVTSIQYNLLEFLYFDEGKTVSDISVNMCLPTSNVSREVRKLTNKNLLYKLKNNTDKRKFNIFLTREGKILLDECFFQVIKGINEKYEHLNEQELNDLTECMKYIIKKLYTA